ncbi:DUF2341 domain-containing protein [Paucibacter aquatile]|uniref:DUF2341 domain-containing protein n=1 Tax=Kinneretia aquatilis TaxID=2070761 RepID=A0A2N8KTH2_9BURK|nr:MULTISPECIES: DUF2341 domain-containing protein [Roseateles]PND36757.1 DUF2341 domain-containing protein [Paucibacter aquatile]
MKTHLIPALLLALSAALPATSEAWWNAEWTQRTRITLNTTDQGLATQEAASAVPVAVRLHSGNFDFASAKEDGSDLRVLAADDKTPLKFSLERFDSVNELAVLWVQLPSVLPGSDKNQFYVYAGNSKVAAGEASPAGGFDAALVSAFHFSDITKPGADHLGSPGREAGLVVVEPNGLLAASLKLEGRAVQLPVADKPLLDAAQLSLSVWVKLDDVASAKLLQWGGLQIAVQAGQLRASVGGSELRGGELTVGRWTQLGLRVGAGKAALLLDGAVVADAAASALPSLGSTLSLGDGARGLADELQISASARSNAWLAISAGAQGAQGKLLSAQREDAAAAEGESHGYMGILIKNLTADAWVVIVICGLMLLIAIWISVAKGLLMGRIDQANRAFLKRFRDATDNLLHLEQGGAHAESPLFRLYQAGVRELAKRKAGQDGAAPLSGASMDAVKASVDADYVRENARLNGGMVMLTIAISGGPFLGLLGTVVGVMITFAAIAQAGDVNVNAIAPGIASALLATVAGLGVAIPSLFSYNYLASRIKNTSSDMQIFIDEFITRAAELYGAR